MTTTRRIISAKAKIDNPYAPDLHKSLEKPEVVEPPEIDIQKKEIKLEKNLQEQRGKRANELLSRLSRRRCNAGGKGQKRKNKNAQKFEKICRDIVELTLEREFHNITIVPHPKPIKVKGYKSKIRDISLLNNPKDFKNQSNIWNLILRDYGSKIIVFDCKNYSTKITSREIYQLYEYLDRGEDDGEIGRLGIILSRNGRYDASAATALKRIKHDGYKIWIFTDKDLKEMLDMYILKGSAEEVFSRKYTEFSGDTP